MTALCRVNDRSVFSVPAWDSQGRTESHTVRRPKAVHMRTGRCVCGLFCKLCSPPGLGLPGARSTSFRGPWPIVFEAGWRLAGLAFSIHGPGVPHHDAAQLARGAPLATLRTPIGFSTSSHSPLFGARQAAPPCLLFCLRCVFVVRSRVRCAPFRGAFADRIANCSWSEPIIDLHRRKESFCQSIPVAIRESFSNRIDCRPASNFESVSELSQTSSSLRVSGGRSVL